MSRYSSLLLILASLGTAAAAPTDGFVNGGVWPDQQGKHINAHGGGVLWHDGAYYWFGEHKVEGASGNQARVGVRCYRSTDLVHWSNSGVALAVSKDPLSDIASGSIIERPKVIHNKRTGKFVMWFHLELKYQGYAAARTGVAIAERVTGPYRFLRSLRPNPGVIPENLASQALLGDLDVSRSPTVQEIEEGYFVRRDLEGGQMARDMTLFVDDDGAAYHIHASEENRTLHVAELSDDYLSFTGRYARILPGRYDEAPALFKHRNKYYLLTSGCTGWAPNAARSAVADSVWGPWRSLGNPCEGANPTNGLGPDKTFGGQSTYVLPLPNKPGRFVAMFDEWRPKNAIDGRYYWLPIEFEGEGFKVRWKDRWEGLEGG